MGGDASWAHERCSRIGSRTLGGWSAVERSAIDGVWACSLLSLIAMTSDSYAEALEYSEQSLAAAVTPWDRSRSFSLQKQIALMLLRRTEEAAKSLLEQRRRIMRPMVISIVWLPSTLMLGFVQSLSGRHSGRDAHLLEEANCDA